MSNKTFDQLTAASTLTGTETLPVNQGGATKKTTTSAIADLVDLSGYSLTSHNHSGVYEPANANIQSHISNTSNPHNTTAAQVGAAVASGKLSQFAATSSAELAGVISDETGTGSLVFSSSPVLVTPNIGTPSAGNLSNCSGLPINTGVSGMAANVATFLTAPSSGNLISAITDETGTGSLVFNTSPTFITPNIGVASGTSFNSITGLGAANPLMNGTVSVGTSTLVSRQDHVHPTDTTRAATSGTLAQFAATTSSQLAGVISDETGTGSLVFATSPTLTTPNIGTPSAGTLTNCTGLPVSGISGLGTGVSTFLATPSSANLLAAVTDETGTGSLLFNNSPTMMGSVKIQGGSIALTIGADTGATSLTDAASKFGRIGVHHYTNAEEPMALIYGTSSSTNNDVFIGGGTSAMNAATRILFYTAADTITTTGTEVARFTNAQNFLIGGMSDTGLAKVTVSNYKTDSTNSTAIWAIAATTLTTTGSYYTVGITGDVTSMNIPAGVTNNSSMIGVMGQAYFSSTNISGSVATLVGLSGSAGINIANAAGASATTVRAGYFYVHNNAANCTITNAYGIYVDNSATVGTITNRWGIYQVGSAARNYFQGNMLIGTTDDSAGVKLRVADSARIDSNLYVGGVSTVAGGTDYTTAKVRNITCSTADPSGGNNGDIWIKYVA